MAQREIRVCDRCGVEIPYGAGDDQQVLTIHQHHDRTIDLCTTCGPKFHEWLDIEARRVGRVRFGTREEADAARASRGWRVWPNEWSTT